MDKAQRTREIRRKHGLDGDRMAATAEQARSYWAELREAVKRGEAEYLSEPPGWWLFAIRGRPGETYGEWLERMAGHSRMLAKARALL